MNAAANPWGASREHAAPVKLHDVMDEELAAKLQREEEEQWERDIAAHFGEDRKVGWCFVEVPSADPEGATVSIMEQEIALDDEEDITTDDPDFALAMELQAQEADEYDRLRRQEASSMDRIQVIEQERPKERQLLDFIGSAGRTCSRRAGTKHQGYSHGRHGFSPLPLPSLEQGPALGRSQTVPGPSWARSSVSGASRLSFPKEGEHQHLHASSSTPNMETTSGFDLLEDKVDELPDSEAATFDEDEQDEDFDDDDLYLEDDCGLPIHKFNSLHLSLRSIDSILDREQPISLAMQQY